MEELDMQLDNYNNDGFFVFNSFLKSEYVKKIREEILSVFNPFVGSADDSKIIELFNSDFDSYLACTKICHQLPSIHALGVSDLMINFIRSRFNIEPVINTRPVLLFSSEKVAKHHFYWKSNPTKI